MKITDLTPPIERKFSLEFTEDELKTLAILMGNIAEQDVRNQVRADKVFIPTVPANRLSNDIYFACEKIFKLG